ncbi:MAG: M6 family metalloprotease domain-containing protein [Bacteroidales bacterium]|nr:M6 family metalloprotease domain-containing protein [Bacteroidales bacterium]
MKKRSCLLIVILALTSLVCNAAYYSNLPYQITQPNGELINCFVSGDEYFNWLHDKDGFTIIQANDGYFYYGEISGDVVKPTKYLVGKVNPSQVGLKKWAKISLKEYNKRKDFYTNNVDQSKRAPHLGTMNNLVVYIRFNDDTEFTTTRQNYDNLFNPVTGKTLRSYYSEVSYQSFTLSSTHYPSCDMTINLSYKDTHNRNYFQPYNAVTNPEGYNGDQQRSLREHTLLKDAITWINANSPIPPDLNIDGDNDGNVDNVCFIIRGSNGAWAELLWAHRWALYSFNVLINEKRVYDYTFQPETQVDVSTLCHEMFHALGAPDLYHYSYDGFTTVGPWDLMESGSGHMGAFMKWDYSDHSWIDSIPEITTSGTYTLHPLTSATNNCYKIASPNSSVEYFVLEYRKKTGTFEGNLPGSGLLVYRIDPSISGNASGPPDEVYLFRPDGTDSTNGSPSLAYFSAESGRTEMNESSNPSSFLQNGTPGGLVFMNVTSADTTISFTVNVTNIKDPRAFTATPLSTSHIRLTWQNNPEIDHIIIAYSVNPDFGNPIDETPYMPGDTIPGGGTILYAGSDTLMNHLNLIANTHYYYKAWSVTTGAKYSFGVNADVSTLCEAISTLPFSEGFEASSTIPNCWNEGNTGVAWLFFQGNGPGVSSGYPADAHTGLRNACLIDQSMADHKNKLVSPIFDFTNYKNVELRFWLFMQKWGSRQDELTVYYRISPIDPWISLQTYKQSISAWTEEIIPLSEISDQFQLAFEGNAKFGFGVCIDDIQVNGKSKVSVEELESSNIHVSPNPSHGIFKITGGHDNNAIQEITIFDCTGKKITGQYGNGEKEFSFDLGSASQGLYFLKIKTEKEVLIRKLTLTK